jgi:hypothetical protein
MSTVLTEGIHPVEFIMSEATWHRSRDAVKIAASQSVLSGNLLGGKVVAADTTQAQSFTGTGNGALTFASPAVSTAARTGRYLLTCTAAAANAGSFSVQTPDGREIGPATVGVAFNKEIKFTIADGATDFVVGDAFSIDIGVEPTDYEHVPWNPAGTDGSEKVRAIACYPVTTGAGETKKITAIRRDAEVNGKCLNLPNGVTAAQTAKAYADLADLGIIVRN